MLPRCCSTTTNSGLFSPDELKQLQSAARKSKCQLHLPDKSKNPRKRTIALGVGWIASNLKAVGKYSSIYTSLGIPYLCVSPSTFHIWSTTLGTSLTTDILNSLDTSLIEPCSLVLHIFSGGGSVVFPKLTKEHANSASQLHTKTPPVCVVFDSGPAEYSHRSGTAAAKLVYKHGGYNFITYHLATGVGIVTAKAFGGRKSAELRNALDSELLNLPQLYFHSTMDTVSPPFYVESVIAEQKAKGRDVTNFCWKDTEHVRHFQTHPEEYKDLVETFLRKCNIVQ